MVDIQNENDIRQIPLEMVGIKNIALPFLIPTKSGESQNVKGVVSFLISLEHNLRGTHMSRLVEILYSHHKLVLNINSIKKIVNEAKNRLHSKNAYVEVSFTYFINKKSPIHKQNSYMDYECKISGLLQENEFVYCISIEIPIMLLCPCSKAISKYNAHNQRSIVTLQLNTTKDFFIEDLVKIVEKESSCELFPLLKRTEEKYVTEKSYENPKFVEDIVRDIALKLKENKNIQQFSVECESLESIHNHNAYAKCVSSTIIKEGKNVNC